MFHRPNPTTWYQRYQQDINRISSYLVQRISWAVIPWFGKQVWGLGIFPYRYVAVLKISWKSGADSCSTELFKLGVFCLECLLQLISAPPKETCAKCLRTCLVVAVWAGLGSQQCILLQGPACTACGGGDGCDGCGAQTRSLVAGSSPSAQQSGIWLIKYALACTQTVHCLL